jgi:hypothetical protein
MRKRVCKLCMLASRVVPKALAADTVSSNVKEAAEGGKSKDLGWAAVSGGGILSCMCGSA